MSHFIYLSTGIHLDCFYFLPLMTNAAVTIHAQVHFIVFAFLKNTCLSFLVDCELLTLRVGGHFFIVHCCIPTTQSMVSTQ